MIALSRIFYGFDYLIKKELTIIDYMCNTRYRLQM